ncbi:MAG TPA: hypothetical protein PLI22_09505, partial [Caldisericia bacterium]|nr:hypothetical protein [Caldisericia bacterium]
MGGVRIKDFIKFDSKIINEVVEKIRNLDNERVYDVISFYSDYEKSIKNISKVVKKGGIVAFV